MNIIVCIAQRQTVNVQLCYIVLLYLAFNFYLAFICVNTFQVST